MSDSDSDTPVGDMEALGLPSLSNSNDDLNEAKVEEDKNDLSSPAENQKSNKRIEAINKIRGEAMNLVSKTEKNKQMFINKGKSKGDSATSASSSSKPASLEINDPRFNYEIILDKGYKLIK